MRLFQYQLSETKLSFRCCFFLSSFKPFNPASTLASELQYPSLDIVGIGSFLLGSPPPPNLECPLPHPKLNPHHYQIYTIHNSMRLFCNFKMSKIFLQQVKLNYSIDSYYAPNTYLTLRIHDFPGQSPCVTETH